MHGTRSAASTQLQYCYRMFALKAEIEKHHLTSTAQGRALTRYLRTQSLAEVNRAPVLKRDAIVRMMKNVAETPRQFDLMLIAFMTAARVGHLAHLESKGSTAAGAWRFTWTYHKMFYQVGAVDALIPKKCIPAELLSSMDTFPKGPVCTLEEQEEIYTIFQALFHGRTYCIRRSALQYYRYDLNMSVQEIMPISLHTCPKTLDKYLTSGTEDIEEELGSPRE